MTKGVKLIFMDFFHEVGYNNQEFLESISTPENMEYMINRPAAGKCVPFAVYQSVPAKARSPKSKLLIFLFILLRDNRK